MLVAIAGSQGAGKTTIINELKKLKYKSIERKTSRSILSDWDVTLQDVNSNHDLTVKFQDEIINRKRRDEIESVQHPADVWLTERTYLDLLVYSTIVLGPHNQYSNWLDEYAAECIQMTQHYDLVFYLKAGHFSIEHDGVRGSNQQYSDLVDIALESAVRKYILPSRLVVIDTPLLKNRVQLIDTFIKSTNNKR